ncbi:MAG: restriction endonuclease [Firmicutes bacterium]|nr:restriction endonuclease [Bacillota bacterium]
MTEKLTKIELFEELAQPDENGVSRWVDVSEFTGRYEFLRFGNGADWARSDGAFGRKYIIEKDKSRTPGNKIDALRTAGFAVDNSYSSYIDPQIKKIIKEMRCVVLGTSEPECDHKNGMKNEDRVMQNTEQRVSDFQPLSKAANDAKRQFCKECRKTGIRYDAKKLGYPMSYYKGGAHHNNEENACIGCFWYDPIEFRKHLQEKK